MTPAAGANNNGKERRLGALKEEASQLELSIGAARSQYDKIKAANKSELQRFDSEHRTDLLAMLQSFAAVQAAAAARQKDVWLYTAAELGAPVAQLAALGGAPASLQPDEPNSPQR